MVASYRWQWCRVHAEVETDGRQRDTANLAAAALTSQVAQIAERLSVTAARLRLERRVIHALRISREPQNGQRGRRVSTTDVAIQGERHAVQMSEWRSSAMPKAVMRELRATGQCDSLRERTEMNERRAVRSPGSLGGGTNYGVRVSAETDSACSRGTGGRPFLSRSLRRRISAGDKMVPSFRAAFITLRAALYSGVRRWAYRRRQ